MPLSEYENKQWLNCMVSLAADSDLVAQYVAIEQGAEINSELDKRLEGHIEVLAAKLCKTYVFLPEHVDQAVELHYERYEETLDEQLERHYE